jgi:hypothetical protein
VQGEAGVFGEPGLDVLAITDVGHGLSVLRGVWVDGSRCRPVPAGTAAARVVIWAECPMHEVGPSGAAVRLPHRRPAPTQRPPSVHALESDIRAWVKAWNDNAHPFIWTKSAEDILERLGRLLHRINGAGN